MSLIIVLTPCALLYKHNEQTRPIVRRGKDGNEPPDAVEAIVIRFFFFLIEHFIPIHPCPFIFSFLFSIRFAVFSFYLYRIFSFCVPEQATKYASVWYSLLFKVSVKYVAPDMRHVERECFNFRALIYKNSVSIIFRVPDFFDNLRICTKHIPRLITKNVALPVPPAKWRDEWIMEFLIF